MKPRPYCRIQRFSVGSQITAYIIKSMFCFVFFYDQWNEKYNRIFPVAWQRGNTASWLDGPVEETLWSEGLVRCCFVQQGHRFPQWISNWSSPAGWSKDASVFLSCVWFCWISCKDKNKCMTGFSSNTLSQILWPCYGPIKKRKLFLYKTITLQRCFNVFFAIIFLSEWSRPVSVPRSCAEFPDGQIPAAALLQK